MQNKSNVINKPHFLYKTITSDTINQQLRHLSLTILAFRLMTSLQGAKLRSNPDYLFIHYFRAKNFSPLHFQLSTVLGTAPMYDIIKIF
jgi:hypothetical protein